MTSWRDHILKQLVPGVARLTLVADPDGLLLEESILEQVRERGFELIPFEDHIAFRYSYEAQFRSRWDRGEETDAVVVLRSPAQALDSLPYDLLQAGRRLAFSLVDVFPGLSYPVVSVLDREDLDALYNAVQRYQPGQLGSNASKEFALRHVFDIAPELIKEPLDLLRVLLRRHYRDVRVPGLLDERFIELLWQDSTFEGWPLERIVPDRNDFLTFIQERWPIFLDREVGGDASCVDETPVTDGLSIPGPANLPLGHEDIRVYMDNLFLEGLLEPVPHSAVSQFAGTWASVGIRVDTIEDRQQRIDRLIERIGASIPTADARHDDWFLFARPWAELNVSLGKQTGAIPAQTRARVEALRIDVDSAFSMWLARRYAGLRSRPPSPPVMLHHLPRFLSRQLRSGADVKIALIVVDGLAMDQWLVIRDALARQRDGLRFREEAVFAWVPSLTSVSRQAIFAGKEPVYFPDSINRTDREATLWSQFWMGEGLAAGEVAYRLYRDLDSADLTDLAECLSHPKLRVAGIVVGKVDSIMHGMQLGSAGMHSQVRQWAEQQYLCELLDMLSDRGFRTYLTSDHGNVEAQGCGRPTEGVVADVRGERARIYSDAKLRARAKGSFAEAVEWEPIGLPADYLALLAPGREAFVPEGTRTVGHGGATVEELIVPLVEIERMDA